MKDSEALAPLVSESASASRLKISAACVGFLADSYDLFAIDLVLLILELHLELNQHQKALLVGCMLCGVLGGQLIFGLLADLLGRKWTFVATALCAVLGAVASAVATVPQLALCRALLGLGVGGEYPLSAAVAAEATTGEQRHLAMALVVSMQGFGMLLAALLAMLGSCFLDLETLWRLLLAFGALPSLVAFGLRWSLEESEAFVSARKEACFKSRERLFETLASSWHVLLGTSGTWFLMNTFTFSLGSFKSSLFQHGTASEEVFREAKMATFTSGCAVLGFGVGALLLRYASRFQLQFYGFLALSLTFMALSVVPKSSQLMLGLVFFLLNLGPNLTCYIIPAEVFPTCVRATCHGVSAASGKLGALAGATALPYLQAMGLPVVFQACGLAAALGVATTWALTPRE